MIDVLRTHKIGVATAAVAAVAGIAWLAFGYFGVHTLFVDDVVDEAAPVFDAPPAALADDATATPVTATSTPPTRADEAGPTGESSASSDATDVSAPDVGTTPAADQDPVEPATTVGSGSIDAGGSTSATAPTTTETAEVDAPATAGGIVTEYTGTFVSEAHPTAGTATVLGNGTGQRFVRFEGFETDNGPDLNVYLFNVNGDRSDYIDLGDLAGNIGDQNYEIPADVDLDVYGEVSIWCVRFGVGFGSAELMAA